MPSPLAIIAGVGPGLGAALARRFAAEGFHVAMIARNEGRLLGLAAVIRETGGTATAHAAELSDHGAVREVIMTIVADHGPPTILIWNAALWDETLLLSLDPAEFDRQLRSGLTAAVTAIQTAAPAMAADGGGTILLTGGGLALAPHRGGTVPSLTAVKGALRGLVHASAPEFAARSLRLGTVTIAGRVASGTAFDPNRIAAAFWEMHQAATPKVEHVFDGT